MMFALSPFFVSVLTPRVRKTTVKNLFMPKLRGITLYSNITEKR